MSADGLDSAFAPLYYIATPSELKIWNKSLSEDAKRRYLTEFWQSRDPNKGTANNEGRDQFYAAIALANKELQGTERSWLEDGPGPDLRQVRRGSIHPAPGAGPEAPPYEVWNYPDLGRWYIFADRTGVGQWRLMVSSDLKEPSQPDWRDILTEDGVRDAGRFLNIDFYSSSTQFK